MFQYKGFYVQKHSRSPYNINLYVKKRHVTCITKQMSNCIFCMNKKLIIIIGVCYMAIKKRTIFSLIYNITMSIRQLLFET